MEHRLIPRRAVGLVMVAAVGAAIVALFGGERVVPCLAFGTCPVADPGPLPLAGTAAGARVALAAFGLAWISGVMLLVGHLWSVDRGRLRTAAMRIVATAAALALVGLVLGLSVRLRLAADYAVAAGAAGLAIGSTIAVIGQVGRRPQATEAAS
jgi:hypothetical protein